MAASVADRLEVMQGDITTLAVDAIVNAANQTLLGGGGVDGAIHRAAGPDLLKACRDLGGCPTGEARITPGFRLPAKFVIHTVGPIYRGRPEDRRLLTRCYEQSLQLAIDHNLTSIAFPAISCGVYGYPISDASQIAIETCRRVIAAHPSIQKVIYVLFSRPDFDVYDNYLKSMP